MFVVQHAATIAVSIDKDAKPATASKIRRWTTVLVKRSLFLEPVRSSIQLHGEPNTLLSSDSCTKHLFLVLQILYRPCFIQVDALLQFVLTMTLIVVLFDRYEIM